MDFRILLSVIGAVVPFFPRLYFDKTCRRSTIPGKYIANDDGNGTYYLMQPEFSKVADGLPGAEGPTFDKDGNLYVVTVYEYIAESRIHNGKAYEDRWSGKLYKIDLETGEKTIACEPWKENYGGRPAGAATDKDGTIWIADLRLGLYKYTPKTGECVQQSTVDTDGNPLQGLVDLMFDHDGNLWINGPATPLAPTPENFVRVQEEKMGVLYYLPRGATKLTRIQNATFQFNNGIAVRGNLLLQVESFGEGITAWDIVGPGKLKNRRVWATMPEFEAEEGWSVGPDGLDIDAAGNVLVAHSGGSFIEVYSPGAKLIGRIKCPFRRPSNLQFAPGSCACYVTDHDTHAVYKFDWLCQGWPAYGELNA